MKFNINHYVRVRLTPKGHARLRHLRISCNEDKDGWSSWQLWTLMEFFGPIITWGPSLPFEEEIEILEEK